MKKPKHYYNINYVETNNLLVYKSQINHRNKRIYVNHSTTIPDFEDPFMKTYYYKPTQKVFVKRKPNSEKNEDRINIISKAMKKIKIQKTDKGKKRVIALYDAYLKKKGYKGMPYQLKKHFGLI